MRAENDRTGQYDKFERPRDGEIAALAMRQHGVVATWQLKDLGYSHGMLCDRAAAGRLHRIHRGVYAVGYRRISQKGRWMAAVLACGPGALLSHRAAIALWNLRPRSAGLVDVTSTRGKHGQPGIRVHNVRSPSAAERTVLDGIPVTSLERTLLDYAAVALEQQLRHALEASERREVFDGTAMGALLERSAGRRGVRALRAAVAELSGPVPLTRSELERLFLGLIREAGFPEPSSNVVVAGEVVDFSWPRQRLVVETDSFRYHRSRRAFENDRRRDAELQVAGYRVLRFTDSQLSSDPGAVTDALRRLLPPT